MTSPVGSAPDRARPGTPARAAAAGAAVALAGAAAIVVLAGLLSIGAGLLVAALAIGRFVGLAVSAAGRGALPTRSAVAMATGLALASIVVGQVGTWLWARAEGGVLDLVDYLAQTFGLLVPLELVLAAVAAWWTTRRAGRSG